MKEQVADEDADVQAALESLPEFDEIEEEVWLLSVSNPVLAHSARNPWA